MRWISTVLAKSGARASSIHRVCLNSIIEHHIHDDFPQVVLSVETTKVRQIAALVAPPSGARDHRRELLGIENGGAFLLDETDVRVHVKEIISDLIRLGVPEATMFETALLRRR